MKKTIRFTGLLLLLLAVCMTGCTKHVTKSRRTTSGATDISLAEERYALVLANEESVHDDLVAEAFAAVMETAERTYTICRPEDGSVFSQQQQVKTLIKEEYSCIAISPNDSEAMEDVLKEALESGIDVCSFELTATPESRELAITCLGTDIVAQTLMDAVLDLAGGEGQWAILSSSSVSALQNQWIDRMKSIMKQDEYKGLELLEIAYGNDLYQTAYDQTRALLQNYPDLSVICVPTTSGIVAAAAAVRDSESDVKITGFGLPSEMADYVGADSICPYFYLWNPSMLGTLTGYVSVALRGDMITGALGERFKAGDLGEYEVTAADDGGTEVILGSPYQFSESNIEYWAGVF